MEIPLRVLLAGDEGVFCQQFRDSLASKNCEVFFTPNSGEIEKAVLEKKIDLLLIENRLSSESAGFQIVQDVKRSRPRTQVIVMTSGPNGDHFHELLQRGASGCFPQSPDQNLMMKTILSIVSGSRLAKKKEARVRKLEKEVLKLEVANKTLSTWNSELLRKLKKHTKSNKPL